MKGETRATLKSPGQIIQEINAEVKPSLSDFDHLRVTKEKDIPQPEPTITIGGCSVASPANITGISAAAKAGKTALTGAILAGAISKSGDVDAFDDLQVLPNTEGKAVIHFDTEQSEADQQHHVNTILKRAGFENTPDCFRSYNIRPLTLDNYQGVTNTICELSAKKFKGVHLIVIDGGADYLASVNDEAQATQIVHYFTRLSIQYNCPVIIIIHLNPGSDKERGHFGSEVQRKCYGLLTITKEGEISTVQPKIMRKSGNGEIPLIHFTFSKDKGYHVQVDAPDKEKQKLDKDRQRHADVAKAVFTPPNSLSYTQAVSAVMQHTSKGERTAKTMISNMTGWGQIVKGSDNNYRLVQNGAS
ncbi:MAG: AAA family ATPase [Chitinophagaceae bacterium]|nr:AAA family ATPase [Microcystis sp. M065S1]MCA6492271.1 AAA family ATPase [Chitinophagaceae bacterium]